LGETKSPWTRRRILLIVTNLVSLGCLIWVLNGAHLGELKDDIATMSWRWVVIGVLADIAVYFFHGLRWSLLLKPVVKVGFWQSVRAVYIGLFANEVLPFKVGEVIRCYLVSRWTKLPMSVSLASALIERIFDGIWLVLCMLITLRFVKMPTESKTLGLVIDSGYVLGFGVLGGAALVAFAMYKRQKSSAVMGERSWQKHLRVLIDDLHLIGHSRYLYFSAFTSIPYLLLQAVPIYCVMQGYGFDLSIGNAFVLLVILRIGSVFPQAPGNLGVFQALTLVTLERVFDVYKPEAKRFSLLLWAIVTLPLLIGGFIALLLSEMRIRHLRREAEASAQEARRTN
jgi:uncharacterized protein (TIRG00374 family)